MNKDCKHIDTRLAHLGLDPISNYGIPNPPIYRTSTILSSSFAQHRGELPKPYTYGRNGTPTSAAFEEAVANIYDAETCISTPSGLAALTTALLAFTQSGGHMLFPDSLYGSTRRFVTNMLPMMGVEAEFYPARINDDISGYIRPSTSLIFVESPGSLTFELQDLPAIVKAARSQTKTASSITIMVDNTWGNRASSSCFTTWRRCGGRSRNKIYLWSFRYQPWHCCCIWDTWQSPQTDRKESGHLCRA